MDNYFGWIQTIGAFIVIVLTWLFGAWDNLIATFITMNILDYVTGVLGAIIEKKLSSEISLNGICKKIFLFILIAVAVLMDRQFNTSNALRTVVISGLIANEGISLLENISKFVPVPQQLKDVLMQLRSKDKGVEK